MHQISLVCLALAGACYIAAAIQRWRGLRTGVIHRLSWPMVLGFTALTGGLAASLAEDGSRDFAFGVLGVWSAMAGTLFAAGWISGPTRGLLALPVGCLAILLAMLGLTNPAQTEESGTGTRLVTLVHAGCMAAHLAASLVAGGAGGIYLLAVRSLKQTPVLGLRLPPLPVLEILIERSLVIAAGLLMAGLAAGGAAMQVGTKVSFWHPAILLSLAAMVLMTVALGLRLSGRLNRRGLALVAVQTMILSGLSTLALQVLTHG